MGGIGIVDYGRGNLRSVEKGLGKAGFAAGIITSPQEMEGIEGLILPGVGAFADAMAALQRGGWIGPLLEFAQAGKPLLGICLGMQVLFEVGEEHGEHRGLGLLPGRVIRFPVGRKIPHMGWNTVRWEKAAPLIEGLAEESWFYFVHSYHALSPNQEVILGTSDYGVRFPAVVGRNNVWGTQFHPEKSGSSGLKLLENFGRLVHEYAHISGH